MLAVRKTSHAFGRGARRFLQPGNRKILAYLREIDDDTILCVANLSRSAQAAGAWGVTVAVLVEINVGQNRTGIAPGPPAVALAEHIASLPALRFIGVQGYEGHLQHLPDEEERG